MMIFDMLFGCNTYFARGAATANNLRCYRCRKLKPRRIGNRNLADGTIYTSNILNQYTDVGGATYGYDLNGNLLFNDVNNYTYDAENRLQSFNDGTVNASYEYDAFNRRVSKTVDGVITQFVYDGDTVIAEYDEFGGLEAEYVTGNSIDEVLTMERGGVTYYYHYDGLGSVTEITDSSGLLIENYTYDPYGVILSGSEGSLIGNPYYFTGRRWDEESGTYYYRARQYDPTIGRFLQRDPLGMVDNVNLYSYVYNNPINYIDPLGLYTLSLGFQRTAGAGKGYTLTTGIVFGISLEKGLQFGTFSTKGEGVFVGVGGSAGFSVGVSKANDINKLSGPAYVSGGSLDFGPSVGLDFETSRTSNANPVYANVGLGFVFPGGETHAFDINTDINEKFSLFGKEICE